MSAENNKALVRRYFEDAWNKHNTAVVDEIYAADFVDRSPDIPGIAHTRDGLKQFLGMYLRGFPDANITLEDQLVDGDRVVTRWTGRGTQTGELMGMPPAARRSPSRASRLTVFRAARSSRNGPCSINSACFSNLGPFRRPGSRC
jgi:predicted ester cyclase